MNTRQSDDSKAQAQAQPATWWQGLARLALMAGRGAGTAPLSGGPNAR